MLKNINITYPILLILSTTKRSFESLGKLIKRSGDTIKRVLSPVETSLNLTHKIAQSLFKNSKILTLAIDDTLLQKIYSKSMVGSGRFFYTKIYRKITAYRLIAALVTNGRYGIPISFGFLFDKELLSGGEKVKSKLDFVKKFILLAQTLFPGKKIRIAADGLFASVEFLEWCLANNIEADLRMHSNRRVEFKGQYFKLNQIECLKPRGRQNARSIQVKWHDLILNITAEKRIDKHNKETIVYIVSTYKSRPIQHVSAYKYRWSIEKFFRTSKQFLGLQECFSTQLETQEKHVAAVLLAYAIAQLDMKSHRLETPEIAIRGIKQHKCEFSINRLLRLDQIFGRVYA